MSVIHDVAAQLDGIQYPPKIPKQDWGNVLILYCESDDIFQVTGAIVAVFSAYDGGTFYWTKDVVFDEYRFKEAMATVSYLGLPPIRDDQFCKIEVIWNPAEIEASWLVKVHGRESAPFDVMEDDEIFCRGAVIELPRRVEE